MLLTYWDALTPLSYMHCIEGVRPDVSLRAYDEKALVTCDPVERPLSDVARRRPVYALLVVDDQIEERTGLVPVPVQDFMLPWGQRYPQLDSLALPAGATRPGSLRWTTGHALLDVGGGARLERFGARVTDRPHPGALGARGDPAAWRAADLRFDRDRGWSGEVGRSRSRGRSRSTGWRSSCGRPTPARSGSSRSMRRCCRGCAIGSRRGWRRARTARSPTAEPPAVLHLFAYTGLVTLALAAAGASVVHVDASKPTVGWARRNAERSGLADRPVRWIVDDARRLHRARDPARPALRRRSSSTHRATGTVRAPAPGGSRTTSRPSSPRPAACSTRTASSS